MARPKSPFGVVELGDGDVVEGFSEAGRDPLLGQLRHLRPHRRGGRALPRARRPRDDDVPGARAERRLLRLPPRRALADGEHAEGAPRRRRARRRPPGVARVRGIDAMTRRRRARSTPWAFEAAPGREALGLRADLGAERGLLRQGAVRRRPGTRSRSSTTREKDESWLVQSGRREGRARAPSATSARRGDRRAGRAFRYRPGTVHRVTAIEDTTILEVSTPHLDDVVRLADATAARAPRRRTAVARPDAGNRALVGAPE